MNKKEYRIQKDEINRIKFLKKEIKNRILKSIAFNFKTTPYKRIYAIYLYSKTNVFSSRNKNYCLSTGKAGSVFRAFSRSRHQVNLLAKQGRLTNVKSNNTK